MNNYFRCKVRYYKLCDDGVQRTVTEQYLVGALSFTEAEARITEISEPYVQGTFEITAIDRFNVAEVFLYAGDILYKSKVELITLDEKSGREKKLPFYVITKANTISEARDNIVKELDKSMGDYSITKIEETKILDIFPPEM